MILLPNFAEELNYSLNNFLNMLRQLFFRLSMICLLCLWFDHAIFAQFYFPNVQLLNVPSRCLDGTVRTNQLANRNADPCSTTPWFASHNTPDLVGTAGTIVRVEVAAKKDYSEGVIYKQTFRKGGKYKLFLNYGGSAQTFKVLLANGIEKGEGDFSVRESIPTPSSSQLIHQNDIELATRDPNDPSFGTERVERTVVISFIPDKDYESLWFFATDERSFPVGDAFVMGFIIKALVCDMPLREIFTSTETTYNVPVDAINRTALQHISLPHLAKASWEIKILPNKKVEIFPFTSNLLNSDPRITLTAGKSILIAPVAGITTSFFEARQGSVLNAFISDECGGFCERFSRWATNHTMVWPHFVNTTSANEQENTWILYENYPLPYNAFKADLKVFNRSGGLVFHKQFADIINDRALTRGSIKWKPGNTLPIGVYTIQLILTNCEGDMLLRNVRTGAAPDVTLTRGAGIANNETAIASNAIGVLVPVHIEDKMIEPQTIVTASQIYTEKSFPIVKHREGNLIKKPNIILYPNPNNGQIQLSTELDIEEAVTIQISNVLGKTEQVFEENDINSQKVYQYDISNLAAGIYMITVLKANKIVYQQKITKI